MAAQDRQKIHDLRDKLNEKSLALQVAKAVRRTEPLHDLEREVESLKQQLRDLGESVHENDTEGEGGHQP